MATPKKRTFITMTPAQFLLSSLLVGVVAGGITMLNSMYRDYSLLPIVERDKATEQCIRVVNLDNGHAFNCNDVDLILRRYRLNIVSEPRNEKLPTTSVQQLPSNN